MNQFEATYEAIDYDHIKNVHSLEGPQAAIREILPFPRPRSLLDVGCGRGTWLKAVADTGISDIMGVDGVMIPPDQLLFQSDRFCQQDLAQPWSLGRKFDVALCLEVAEHLDCSSARTLLDALVLHSDTILFSAACPGQPGQHHVNCQWPEYWQRLFNERGYACSDGVRWQIWNQQTVEPWYRQNLFVAHRNAELAGREARIPSVIHPDMMPLFESALGEHLLAKHANRIAAGCLPVSWYIQATPRAIVSKIIRFFRGN